MGKRPRIKQVTLERSSDENVIRQEILRLTPRKRYESPYRFEEIREDGSIVAYIN